MTRDTRWHFLVVSLFIATPVSISAAQVAPEPTGPSDEQWSLWTEGAVGHLHDAFDRRARNKQSEEEEAGARRTSYVAVREASLEPETAATSLDRLSLALRTDVGDAEAGVSVAPAILFGSHDSVLAGFSVIAATLKEERTRIGAKYTWASTRVPADLSDVGLAPCPFEEENLRESLAKLRPHFIAVCDALGRFPSELAGPTRDDEVTAWRHARAACELRDAGEPPRTLTQARHYLLIAIESARSRANAEQSEAIRGVSVPGGAVEKLKRDLPMATTCYNARALKSAFHRSQWRRAKLRVGLLATADFFPRKSGFNPDPAKPLPHGENAAWLMQAEGSFERRRVNVVGSLGWVRQRLTFGEPSYTSVRPSLSASWIVTRLGGGRLLDDEGDLQLTEDGKAPPVLVAGFLLKADIARTRPESQVTKWNSAELQVFLDFRVTDKLSFRLGIPCRGQLAVRKADPKATPPVSELRDLQWTLPVFVATVLKL